MDDPEVTSIDNSSSYSFSLDNINTNLTTLANRETKQLGYVKLIVVGMLMTVTSLICFSIYYVTHRSEIMEFETQFQNQAARITEEFGLNFLHSIGAIDNLGVTITSHVASMNLAWPFALVPEFDIRGASASSLAKTPFLAFIPKVETNDRVEYEEYVTEFSFWVDQALARKNGDPIPESPIVHNHGNFMGGSSDMGGNDYDGHHMDGDMGGNEHGSTGGQEAGNGHHMNSDHAMQNDNTNMPNITHLMPSMEANSTIPHHTMTMENSTLNTGNNSTINHDEMMGHTSTVNMGSHPEMQDSMMMGENSTTNIDGIVQNHTNTTMNMVGNFSMQHNSPGLKSSTVHDHGEMTSTTTMYSNSNQDGNTMGEGKNGNMTTSDFTMHDHHTGMEMNRIDYPDISPHIFRFGHHNMRIPNEEDGPYYPIFQCAPVDPDIINYNLMSQTRFGEELQTAIDSQQIVVGRLSGHSDNEDPLDPLEQLIRSSADEDRLPMSQILFPIFDSFGPAKKISGFLAIYLFWNEFFSGSLPALVEGLICVVENTCGQQVSYEVNSMQDVVFLGSGDYHDRSFNYMEARVTFKDFVGGDDQTGLAYSGVVLNNDFCPYTLRIYPSNEMKDNYITNKPIFYTTLVFAVFVLTSVVFLGYDCLVERRQKVVMENARQTNVIVSSLFPKIVRDRLFKDGRVSKSVMSQRQRLRSYLDVGETKASSQHLQPIADLFPETTVIFADIQGFTAWSSVREPPQVFSLLEDVYSAFDGMARKMEVFKVETIGDCYVAVTGLPDPQKDHAVIMAKFACRCLAEFNRLTKDLEVSLGPDTGDLKLRVGLNSGPVTAGVLRGEKSRFQLFGDTVNTAARMESTGKEDCVHCSQSTADQIAQSGCDNWLMPREDVVDVKGKGSVRTYWINAEIMSEQSLSARSIRTGQNVMNTPESTPRREKLSTILSPIYEGQRTQASNLWGNLETSRDEADSQKQRLVDWHVEVLGGLLKQIKAQRKRNHKIGFVDVALMDEHRMIPISEVVETIVMPTFNHKKAKKMNDLSTTKLDPATTSQLREYVNNISRLYHKNPFHNFGHASHVTMAAKKLLSRVVAPDLGDENPSSVKKFASNLHDYTYGITSDPLTQFAVVFSALIHDVDHGGVSNFQLVKENADIAIMYEGKSVAEQNSVDLAWEMLMSPMFEDLRNSIFTNDSEFARFRQLVVNSVIATDIFDKDLKELRNKRWDKAFHNTVKGLSPEEDFNLKATIVIEHIIQAADVSHTMQHWKVYQKWNACLFREMYSAYKAGRGGEKDPSEGWYKGELWFFDNYVIPLAKKLKECGVFGVASAECLNYALENRREWEKKGLEIVSSMVNRYSSEAISDEQVQDDVTSNNSD